MSDKILAFPKKIKPDNKQTKELTANIKAISRNIAALIKELSKLDIGHVKQTDTILESIVKSIDSGKAISLLMFIKPHIYLYWECISAKLDNIFLQKLFKDISDLPIEKISDFLEITYLLQFNKCNPIEILAKTSLCLSGNESLFNAYNVQNNYIKDIILKRPHFSVKDKVNSILNACKTSEGIYVIKHGNLFFNTEKNGNIRSESNIGSGESRALGLFTGDMQYIDSYMLHIKSIDGEKIPSELKYRKDNGYASLDKKVYDKNVSVLRYRLINNSLFEKIRINNKKNEKIILELTISCNIRDIFEIRCKIPSSIKKTECFCDNKGCSAVNNRFNSGNSYGLRVNAELDSKTVEPEHEEDCKLKYSIEIEPNSKKEISFTFQPLVNDEAYTDGVFDSANTIDEALKQIKSNSGLALPKVIIEGDIPNMQKTINRCIQDINMLVNYIKKDDKVYRYISAGLPRYSALFGRDSLITALQILPLNPEIARDTLELLALYQGKSFEDRHESELKEIKNSNWSEPIKNSAIKGIKDLYLQKEEEEGKILHELRVGEFAKTGAIPHSPYYGTVDATPLWLILFFDYYFLTKDTEFLKKHMSTAQKCLEWIDNNMSEGYLRFTGSDDSKVKIKNQGWKDAGDSIRHVVGKCGNLIDPARPIALAEVQGYTYRAFCSMSIIYFEQKNRIKAEQLKKKATKLKAQFNNDFWLEDEGFYSMALDKFNNPVKNITSNIGHCIAMGIIDEKFLNILEDKLMSEEMYTGWGIRTLNSSSDAYDPLSYHNGSVWVHDSAFAAIGLSDESIITVAKSLFEAANHFDNNRLPELFAGFDRKNSDIKHYPEACSPQAWASGATIWLLLKLLECKTEKNKLIINESRYPAWLKKFVSY